MAQVLSLLRFLISSAAILGGLHGIVLTVRLFFSKGQPGVIVFLLLVCMLSAYAYVTVAGLLFWRYPSRSRSLLLWAQAIQVPWISLPGLVYKFAAGLAGSVAFVFSHAGEKYSMGYETHWKVGSSCKLSFFQNAPLELGVNVIPLAVIFLLRHVAHLTKDEHLGASGGR